MGKKFQRILMLGFVLFIITNSAFVAVNGLDTSKIGVFQGDIFQGYVVLVHINDSATSGVFGNSLDMINQGDLTNTKTITQLNNTTGEVTISHSSYPNEPSNFGWDGTSKLDSMCSNVIYTDWTYWLNYVEGLNTEPIIHNQYFNTERYFGYITESNGTKTDANGVVTETSHRQDCIYNKDTGFMEFFGLYELEYRPENVISVSTVEQFIPQNGNQSFNASLYFDLMSLVNPVIDVIIPSKWIPIPPDTNTNTTTTSDTTIANTSSNTSIRSTPSYTSQISLTFNLNFQLWFSLCPIMLIILFKSGFSKHIKSA